MVNVERFMHRCGSACLGLLLVTFVAGCAGVKMQRASGAHRYRALPLGTEVKVVGAELQLATPFTVIGGLRWLLRTAQQEPDTKSAERKLKRTAAKYGCDAVVGLAVTSEERKSHKKVTTIGEGGKRVTSMKESIVWVHTFAARCVRTANAPGGLLKGTGKTAELADAAKPPATLGDDGAGEGGAADDKAATADSTPAQKPIDPAAQRVWERLGEHRGDFLTNWRDGLGRPPDDELTVLEALGELMVQVTGPAGFWQRTVRSEWFGCLADPAQDQCKKLDAAIAKFGAWERLRKQVGKQSEATAKGFLRAHLQRIESYFDELVPRQPNLTGMQQTLLYMKKLR